MQRSTGGPCDPEWTSPHSGGGSIKKFVWQDNLCRIFSNANVQKDTHIHKKERTCFRLMETMRTIKCHVGSPIQFLKFMKNIIETIGNTEYGLSSFPNAISALWLCQEMPLFLAVYAQMFRDEVLFTACNQFSNI